MSKDSHLIVSTWKEIAEYFPGFSEHQVRKRFGNEMKLLGVVYKGAKPNTRRPEPVIWGIVWKIEKYYAFKARRRELGVHNAARTIQDRTIRNTR